MKLIELGDITDPSRLEYVDADDISRIEPISRKYAVENWVEKEVLEGFIFTKKVKILVNEPKITTYSGSLIYMKNSAKHGMTYVSQSPIEIFKLIKGDK